MSQATPKPGLPFTMTYGKSLILEFSISLSRQGVKIPFLEHGHKNELSVPMKAHYLRSSNLLL